MKNEFCLFFKFFFLNFQPTPIKKKFSKYSTFVHDVQVGNISLMLKFHHDIVYNLISNHQSLLVMSKGLGVEKVMFSFCERLSSLRKNHLIFLLNFHEYEEERYKSHHPGLVSINSKTFTLSERERIYEKKGGIFFITNRILIYDLLKGIIPVERVLGFVIKNCEQLVKKNYVSFSLNVFFKQVYDNKILKQEVKDKIIKKMYIVAISESPGKLVHGVGSLKLLMESLYLNRLVLYPRFQRDVNQQMSKQPEIIEIQIPLTPNMEKIQINLKFLIIETIKRIKALNKKLNLKDFNFDTYVYGNKSSSVLGTVDRWNLKEKTRSYFDDLNTLKKLYYYLTFYDCVTFYNFLENIRIEALLESERKDKTPNWLLTDEADIIFNHAKNRVFEVENYLRIPEAKRQKTMTQFNRREDVKKEKHEKITWILEENPKWKMLHEIFAEIKGEIRSNQNVNLKSTVLIMVKGGKACSQLRNYLSIGPKKMLMDLARRIVSIQVRRKEKYYISIRDKRRKKRRLQERHNTEEIIALTKYFSERKKKKEKRAVPTTKEYEEYFDVLQHEIPNFKELVIIVQPIYGIQKIFESTKPNFVILYDCNLEVIRRLEMYKCLNRGTPLRIYWLIQQNSSEQGKHLSKCKWERINFERLISKKKRLIITPIEQLLENEMKIKKTESEKKSVMGSFRNTRKGGNVKNEVKKRKVIVDTREFRSMLPICLNEYGFEIIPKHLSVGDYIISKNICVERKSYTDLIQSFTSGRLHGQCLNMIKKYSCPSLLIQFEDSNKCSLFMRKELDSKITINHPSSKLVILMLNTPELHVFWGKSSEDTAELVEMLKNVPGDEEPNEEIVEDLENDEENEASVEFLRRLPGVNERNMQKVIDSVENIFEFSQLGLQRLQKLLGKSNGKELYDFFREGE